MPPGRVLFLAVSSRDTVDEIFRKMGAAGYASQKAPEDGFWGARYAIFEDPDGNSIGIMSPIDPDRRRTPGRRRPWPRLPQRPKASSWRWTASRLRQQNMTCGRHSLRPIHRSKRGAIGATAG